MGFPDDEIVPIELKSIWYRERLIANCILYYNASILSNVLVHREDTNDVQGVEVLKQISPVAWQHINLYGRYEFRKCTQPIDLEDVVRQLTQSPSH